MKIYARASEISTDGERHCFNLYTVEMFVFIFHHLKYHMTMVFCETQWRHSVKTRFYNTPSPILHSVKRSDVTRWKQGYITPLPHTSFCETQWRHSVKTRLYNTPSPILHFVKRSDVTRWKQGYITPPPPYFILWNAVTSLGENKLIQEPFPILHCISQFVENKGGRGHWVSQN